MASINTRKETGKLYIDFRYRNVRCREQSDLTDTKNNRERLQKLVDRIEAEILLGQFDYAATFPNSSMLKKIRSIDAVTESADTIPTFRQFAKIWFDEKSVEWRQSYKVTVEGILSSRLIDYFGDFRIDEVSKPQILNFRADLANTKKKTASYFLRRMLIGI